MLRISRAARDTRASGRSPGFLLSVWSAPHWAISAGSSPPSRQSEQNQRRTSEEQIILLGFWKRVNPLLGQSPALIIQEVFFHQCAGRSLNIVFSPPLTHLLTHLPWNFGRFYLFQWPTCRSFGLLSRPGLAWSLHPTPPLSHHRHSLLVHTLLINTHDFCAINYALVITHCPFTYIRCDICAQRRPYLASSFDALFEALISHSKFKYKSFTHQYKTVVPDLFFFFFVGDHSAHLTVFYHFYLSNGVLSLSFPSRYRWVFRERGPVRG